MWWLLCCICDAVNLCNFGENKILLLWYLILQYPVVTACYEEDPDVVSGSFGHAVSVAGNRIVLHSDSSGSHLDGGGRSRSADQAVDFNKLRRWGRWDHCQCSHPHFFFHFGMAPCWSLLGLLSWSPICRRSHGISILSCQNLTAWQGTKGLFH